jgi:CRP-like cAMP-binding protein
MEVFIRKLERRDRLSGDEKQALEHAVGRVEEFPRDTDIVRQHARPTESALLVEGLASRYTILADGGRQISAVHINGDFVDLHCFLIKTMDHGVAALTPCRVAFVPHERLAFITEQHPHLGRMLWLSTLIDAAIFRQWLVSMGRRSALGQVAHFFCEHLVRHQITGTADDRSFPLPITQAELGDALGLSVVHVNRMVQELRMDGLIAWQEGRVTILDFDRLANTAEFDPTYLCLDPEPR